MKWLASASARISTWYRGPEPTTPHTAGFFCATALRCGNDVYAKGVSSDSMMTEEVKGWLIMGSLILLMMIYPLSIFLPRQRCPHCNKWFSLPKLVDQKGDRERVQCRSCNYVWERFSYRGGVSAGGDGGGDGGSVG